MTETCENCRFWKRGYREFNEEGESPWHDDLPWGSGIKNEYGCCRIRSPNATATEFDDGFARLHMDDWCGEHQPFEAKEPA